MSDDSLKISKIKQNSTDTTDKSTKKEKEISVEIDIYGNTAIPVPKAENETQTTQEDSLQKSLQGSKEKLNEKDLADIDRIAEEIDEELIIAPAKETANKNTRATWGKMTQDVRNRENAKDIQRDMQDYIAKHGTSYEYKTDFEEKKTSQEYLGINKVTTTDSDILEEIGKNEYIPEDELEDVFKDISGVSIETYDQAKANGEVHIKNGEELKKEIKKASEICNYHEQKGIHGEEKLGIAVDDSVKAKETELTRISAEYQDTIDNEGIISAGINKALEFLDATSRRDVEGAINEESKNIQELKYLAVNKDIKGFMEKYSEVTGTTFRVENFEELTKTEQKLNEAKQAEKIKNIAEKLKIAENKLIKEDNYNLDSFENYLRSETPNYSPLEIALFNTYKDPSKEYGDPEAEEMVLEWIRQKTDELGLQKANQKEKYHALVNEFTKSADKLSDAILENKNIETYTNEYKNALRKAYGNNIPQQKLEEYISNQETGKTAIQTSVMIGAGMLSGGSAFVAALSTGIISTAEKGSDKKGLTGSDMASVGKEMAFTYAGFKIFSIAAEKVTPAVSKYLASKGISEVASNEIAGFTGSVAGGTTSGGIENAATSLVDGDSLGKALKKAGTGMISGAGTAAIFHSGMRGASSLKKGFKGTKTKAGQPKVSMMQRAELKSKTAIQTEGVETLRNLGITVEPKSVSLDSEGRISIKNPDNPNMDTKITLNADGTKTVNLSGKTKIMLKSGEAISVKSGAKIEIDAKGNPTEIDSEHSSTFIEYKDGQIASFEYANSQRHENLFIEYENGKVIRKTQTNTETGANRVRTYKNGKAVSEESHYPNKQVSEHIDFNEENKVIRCIRYDESGNVKLKFDATKTKTAQEGKVEQSKKVEIQKSTALKTEPVSKELETARNNAQKVLDDLGIISDKNNISLDGKDIVISGLNEGNSTARIKTNPDGTKTLVIEGTYKIFTPVKKGMYAKLPKAYTDEYNYDVNGKLKSSRTYDPSDDCIVEINYYENGNSRTFKRTDKTNKVLVERELNEDGTVKKDLLTGKEYKHNNEPYVKPSPNEPQTEIIMRPAKIKHPLFGTEISLDVGAKITKSPDGKILSYESRLHGHKSKSTFEYYKSGEVSGITTDISGEHYTYTEATKYYPNGNKMSETANDSKTWRINGDEYPIQAKNSKVSYDTNGKATKIEYTPNNKQNGEIERISIQPEFVEIPGYSSVQLSAGAKSTFDKSGKLIFTQNPSGEKFYCEYDAKGKTEYVEHTYAQGGRAETEFTDGIRSLRTRYTADGLKASETTFHPNGQIKSSKHFDKNNICRDEKTFDENGKPLDVVYYDKTGKKILSGSDIAKATSEKTVEKANKSSKTKEAEKTLQPPSEDEVFDPVVFWGKSSEYASKISKQYEALRHVEEPYTTSAKEIEKLQKYSNPDVAGIKYGGSWNRRMSLNRGMNGEPDAYHVSLNVEPSEALIKELDRICIEHGTKMHYKYLSRYELDEAIDAWGRRLDPITVYLADGSEAILAEIQKVATPYVRGSFGNKAVGKEISKGICVAKEPSVSDCQDLLRRAKTVDPDLAEGIIDYSTDGKGSLSAGQFAVAEKILNERIAELRK